MPSALVRRVTPRRLRALAAHGLLDAKALEDALLYERPKEPLSGEKISGGR